MCGISVRCDISISICPDELTDSSIKRRAAGQFTSLAAMLVMVHQVIAYSLEVLVATALHLLMAFEMCTEPLSESINFSPAKASPAASPRLPCAHLRMRHPAEPTQRVRPPEQGAQVWGTPAAAVPTGLQAARACQGTEHGFKLKFKFGFWAANIEPVESRPACA